MDLPDRGSLVWLLFSPQAGSEQAGRRPGIVNLVGALTADVPPLATPSASPGPTTGAASSPPTGRSPWLIVGFGVVLVVVAALGLLLVGRRRTPG